MNVRTKDRTSSNKESNATSRLEVRIPPDFHETLKRVAQMQGRTMSDFVIAAAIEAVNKAITEEKVMRYSMEAQEDFVNAFLNPPEPNEALKRSFARHKKLIGT